MEAPISTPSYEPIPTANIARWIAAGSRALSCHVLQAPAQGHDRITAFLSHSLTTSGLADCQDAALQPRMDLTHGSSSPSSVSSSVSPCSELRIGMLGLLSQP